MVRMATRLISTFLALAILWSGFTSWEWEAPSDGSAVVLATPGSAIDDGSVTDHHLDDQPVQSPSDVPAMLPWSGWTAAPDSAHGRPPSAAHRVPDTPFLEGLRRPPRSA